MTNNVQIHGTYPFDGFKWRRVRSITPFEAAKILGIELTEEQEKEADRSDKGLSPNLYLFLNKGFVVIDGEARPKVFGTDERRPDKWERGTRAIYLHDGNYSLIEWVGRD